jgi:hypothetical protein
LTSHCQESSRLARKLVGGLLLFLLFLPPPHPTTLEIKRHVRSRYGTIHRFDPSTHFCLSCCVCLCCYLYNISVYRSTCSGPMFFSLFFFLAIVSLSLIGL